jgi:hypothetical protein
MSIQVYYFELWWEDSFAFLDPELALLIYQKLSGVDTVDVSHIGGIRAEIIMMQPLE